MGKVLIIRGANFGKVAVGQIEIDSDEYTDLDIQDSNSPGRVNSTTGDIEASPRFKCSKLIDVNGYKVLKYQRVHVNHDSATGLAFYAEDGVTWVGGEAGIDDGEVSYTLTKTPIPPNAKKMRFTYYIDLPGFYAKAK